MNNARARWLAALLASVVLGLAGPVAGQSSTGLAGNSYIAVGDGTHAALLSPDESAYVREYVQALYVAYYGRPADPGGLDFWAALIDAEWGSLDAVIEAFGKSEEFHRRYGGLGHTALVTEIYRQTLGRDPDPAGRDWYVGELIAGNRTLQTIALDVLNGATTAPDSTVVDNKLEVAKYYTDKVAAGCDYGVEQDVVAFLSGVTADPLTVAAAKAGIDSWCGLWKIPPPST